MRKLWFATLAFLNCAFALEQAEEKAILSVIENYANAWNQNGGKGFGTGFAEDADFVNIFGMKFSGRAEIEERHVQILKTFLRGSKLEITHSQLREIQPGLVVALVDWKLQGFRAPGSDLNRPGEERSGVFTQVFVKKDKQWEIAASQNTLAVVEAQRTRAKIRDQKSSAEERKVFHKAKLF